MNEDKYLMWRACISIVHLDGKVTDEERAWAEERIENLPFLEEQRKQLLKDLNTPEEKTIELFEALKSPADKAFVLHMIRTIGHEDGEFSAEEKAAFKKIQSEIESRVDISEMEKKIIKMEEDSSRYSYEIHGAKAIVNRFSDWIAERRGDVDKDPIEK